MRETVATSNRVKLNSTKLKFSAQENSVSILPILERLKYIKIYYIKYVDITKHTYKYDCPTLLNINNSQSTSIDITSCV